jgi:hypothetical protein
MVSTDVVKQGMNRLKVSLIQGVTEFVGMPGQVSASAFFISVTFRRDQTW